LEALVARELRDLGYLEQAVENGKVSFVGTERAIARANIWLRCADRVLLEIGQFTARSFEELFQQTKALPWEEWISADAEFPVIGKSIKSQLYSVPDCQAIVKKAIVERLKETYGLNWFPENGPRYRVEVALLKDQATLTIDTSGAGLHKRGYRAWTGSAPLKETLAAALVQLSRWREDRAFIDPCCGTGTLPIEAAWIAQHRAPGWTREFVAEQWPNLPQSIWLEARQEAADLVRKELKFHVYGSDIDDKALDLARVHIREAGLENLIFVQRLPAAQVESRFRYGHLVTNPPYGQRLGDQAETETLYTELGQLIQRLDTWSLHMITALPHPEEWIGRRWDKSRKLYNGRLECHYYQFFGPKPAKKTADHQEQQEQSKVN
jgi:putative N6-adenine-specific DNA methylase